ncbi:antibiotic biosynthesis monooxygenase family protein [Pseudomonas koreensis]|uniref:Antibiotic biosynthesis monooxygenase n=1 Tax=Pseudomonas koreensis TaxID=198620 RepID=A0A9X2XG18_9PSED|nr:antibiotic biosynthesis monooxygenase [Pseudomonas koreensis]MCU7248305.1 antibiotic biosynthesis monooxygenase [Pseudomonas koreensis]
MMSETPEAPYYAVIFTSTRTEGDQGYAEAAERMLELVREQPGFLGVESVRGTDGVGVTVSYWASEAAILAWKEHPEHRLIRERGRSTWYATCHTRVCRVERDYRFG